MLNLIQTHLTGWPRFEKQLAVGLGICISVGLILHEEFVAQAALQHAQSEVARDANGAAITHSENTSPTIAQGKQAVAASLVRLEFLDRRQTLRDDVTAVQEASRLVQLGHGGNAPPGLKFQTQQWQQGRFVWEGLAVQAHDLDRLLQALNQLPHWTQAPALVQLQSDTAEQGGMLRKGQRFVLQGEVQSPLPKGP